MLKLLNMLFELLSANGMTFDELSRMLHGMWQVGKRPALEDREAFRTWLRALIDVFRQLVAGTATGQDAQLMALASSLTEERWPTAQQMFDLLLSETQPMPDDGSVLALARVLAEGSGLEQTRVAMLCYTLSRVVRLASL